MKNKAIIGISAAAMAAGLGLGMGQLANAEDQATPTPSASSQETSPSQDAGPARDGGHGEWGPGHGASAGRGGAMSVDLESLAEKLGVEQDALVEAMAAARESLTPPERPSDPADQTEEERDAARAEFQSEFAAGIAAELGLGEADVTTALEEVEAERDATRAEQEQAVLDEAVSDGTLTQAEADAVAKAVGEGIVHISVGRGR